jgi:tetratricopeptide (TPR) repeat protein
VRTLTVGGFLWLAVGLLPPPASGTAGLQEEDPVALYQRGNRLYQEDDYTGAVEAYRRVLEGGLESADLYYNLGNAHFKAGSLGRAILSYERALRLRPGDSDIRANLELARSLTADEIEPLPRFWVLSVLSWWVNLLPRTGLLLTLVLAYLVGAGGIILLILSRRMALGRLGTWLAAGGGLGILLFGCTLLVRERLVGEVEWGIVMEDAAAVQSAPSEEDDLTLFRVHEGTRVRVDRAAEGWLEIVLEDGKVGWVPSDVLEII